MINFDEVSGSWRVLDSFDHAAFVDSRLQLHWAAQIVAAVGNTLLEQRADDSHTALQWLRPEAMLVGELSSPEHGCRGALDVANFTLHLLDSNDESIAHYPLSGRTLQQGLDWMADEVSRTRSLASGLSRRQLDLPSHPVSSGAVFEPVQAALHQLAATYANGALFLKEIAEQLQDTTPVLCWPHHFDIGLLVGQRSPEGASIGVGLSPGDHYYPLPYWYANAHPWPDRASPQPLEAGHWHDHQWNGAVLSSEEVLAEQDQAGTVARYLNSALRASVRLLGV